MVVPPPEATPRIRVLERDAWRIRVRSKLARGNAPVTQTLFGTVTWGHEGWSVLTSGLNRVGTGGRELGFEEY